jgi:hypothetical protein
MFSSLLLAEQPVSNTPTIKIAKMLAVTVSPFQKSRAGAAARGFRVRPRGQLRIADGVLDIFMAEISMQVDVTFHNAPRMRGYWGTLGVEVSPKRMQLLHELLPTGTIAVPVNPSRPAADALEGRSALAK